MTEFLLETADQLSASSPDDFYVLSVDRSEVPFQHVVQLSWDDGRATVSGSVVRSPNLGNVTEYTNLSIAAGSLATVRCGVNFSTGGASLVLLLVLANFEQQLGAVAMTMNSDNSPAVTVEMLPRVPFMWWSEMQDMNPATLTGSRPSSSPIRAAGPPMFKSDFSPPTDQNESRATPPN